MAEIRAFRPDDIAPVAALRRRVFARSRWATQEQLERYLHRVFFESPWVDPGQPSWLATRRGEVVGFIGIVPRPLATRERPVRGAVATQLMVSPEERGVLAPTLLRHAFAGAQEVLYTDVATEPVRRLWLRLGGSSVPLCSLFWSRPLRRGRDAARRRLGGGGVARGVRLAARPLLAAVDAAAAAPLRRAIPGRAEELDDPAVAAERLPALAPARALFPRHGAASLEWLLTQAAARWPAQRLRRVVVRDDGGQVVGWFVFLDGDGGSALVLQLAAAPGWQADVLRHLFREAWRGGAVSVRGRVEAPFLEALGQTGCRFHPEGHGLLVHSRDPALLRTVLGGEALLSGLDGEWWLDF